MDGDEKGASDDDYNGYAEDAQPEQLRKAAPDAQGVSRADGAGRLPDGEGGVLGQRQGEGIQGLAGDTPEEFNISALRFTSGPIPDADLLLAYPPEIQARILDWHEREVRAVFDDESRRQDELAKGEVRQGYMNLAFSFIVDALIVGGALFAFSLTQNPNVFWSYTVLGASIIGNVAVHFHGNRKAGREKDDEET